jgi:hypothetical protein
MPLLKVCSLARINTIKYLSFFLLLRLFSMKGGYHDLTNGKIVHYFLKWTVQFTMYNVHNSCIVIEINLINMKIKNASFCTGIP